MVYNDQHISVKCGSTPTYFSQNPKKFITGFNKLMDILYNFFLFVLTKQYATGAHCFSNLKLFYTNYTLLTTTLKNSTKTCILSYTVLRSFLLMEKISNYLNPFLLFLCFFLFNQNSKETLLKS